MSLATRSGRVKLPPEQPSIPQRKGAPAAYWLYLAARLRAAARDRRSSRSSGTCSSRSRSGAASENRSSSVSRTGRSSSRTRTSGRRSRTPIWMVHRDGRRTDHHRPRCRRAPVRRRRPQVRRQGRQLPAGDLLPAADPPHRGRRHRDRLDRAARRGRRAQPDPRNRSASRPTTGWDRCPRRSSC